MYHYYFFIRLVLCQISLRNLQTEEIFLLDFTWVQTKTFYTMKEKYFCPESIEKYSLYLRFIQIFCYKTTQSIFKFLSLFQQMNIVKFFQTSFIKKRFKQNTNCLHFTNLYKPSEISHSKLLKIVDHDKRFFLFY